MALITEAAVAKVVELLQGELTYLGLGTGTTPLTVGSTTLSNETIRKATYITIDENTIIAEIYLDESEGNGVTFTEAGCFVDGTSDINTGELFLGGQLNVTKNATQSLTISMEITVEAVNT